MCGKPFVFILFYFEMIEDFLVDLQSKIKTDEFFPSAFLSIYSVDLGGGQGISSTSIASDR